MQAVVHWAFTLDQGSSAKHFTYVHYSHNNAIEKVPLL